MADEASSEALTNLAAGAAQQAVHGGAEFSRLCAHVLKSDPHIEAIELDNDDIANHPLMLRFRLFEMGRWPVSLIGNSLNLF